MTTAGTERLEIIAVEELPENIRKYFIELSNTVFSEKKKNFQRRSSFFIFIATNVYK